MAYIYLASPYTSSDKFVQIARYRCALRASAELMKAGELVFCPVAYGHSVEDKLRETFPWDYWIRWSKAMLSPARSLYVLTLPGWEDSKGLALEVRLAHELEIPVLGYPHGTDCEHVSGYDILREFGLSPRQRIPPLNFPRDDARD